jgi:hypothetical protein
MVARRPLCSRAAAFQGRRVPGGRVLKRLCSGRPRPGAAAFTQRRNPYSDRKLLIGLASAAFTARKLIVTSVIRTAMAAASTNIHPPMGTR